RCNRASRARIALLPASCGATIRPQRGAAMTHRSLRIRVLAMGAPFVLAGIAYAGPADGSRPVTFTKDVAPILQAKCQECHQPDSIAPMSLITYQDARPWARSIKERVATRQMPPWHIDKTVGVQQFKNDMS